LSYAPGAGWMEFYRSRAKDSLLWVLTVKLPPTKATFARRQTTIVPQL
jgi:hypothetical protein